MNIYWILKSCSGLVTGLILISFNISAQYIYPAEDQKYFTFPIRPNQPNTLAGTMGELRRTHFHNGIDIRTGGRTGLPVYSAADGYVSRIAVSPGGYGNALYVRHPNGTITVYAHLQEFEKPIAEFVLKEQYRTQQFAINLFPAKDQFPVKRGAIIAYSGNSGSSGGPHLHFDIRNYDQDLLDPLRFNFNEIKDTQPPHVHKVALKTMDINSRINDQFGRFEFDIVDIDDHYMLLDTIRVNGTIGIEVYAYDRQNNTRFRTGISVIELKLDNNFEYRQKIDKLSFSEKRSFNVHTDYPSLMKNGYRYHKLYVDEGNDLNIYETNVKRGKIHIDDNQLHHAHIKLFDTFENVSMLDFHLQGTKTKNYNITSKPTEAKAYSWEIIENTLKLYALRSYNALIYSGQKKYIYGPDYWMNDSISVFLWDLSKGLPDSIDFHDITHKFNFASTIPPDTKYTFFSKSADITFTPRDLYDTLYFQYEYIKGEEKGEVFNIGNQLVPLRHAIEVTLKPEFPIQNKDYASVYSISESGNLSYVGGRWKNETITFYTGRFGKYTIASDTIKPEIRPVIINKDRLVYRMDDEMSGINNYRVTVNGNWVLMHYDPKRKTIWSEKLDKSKPFEGTILLEVTDQAGNKKTHSTKL